MPDVDIKFPKTMGACADLLHDTRQKRLELQKKVDELKAEESALTEYIINNLPKSEGGAVGRKVRVTIVQKQVPQVKDWDAFYEYIRKNAKKGGFALLNRAVNRSAVREIWEDGKKVPGVEPFTTLTLSINKL